MSANYVEFDIPNQQIAREFIIANADAVSKVIGQVLPDSTFSIGYSLGTYLRPASDWGLRIVIDQFMARFPRAKGTKKQPLLRQFWAACYAFKRVQSIPPRRYGYRLPIIWYYDESLRAHKTAYNGVSIGKALEKKIVQFDEMGRALPELSLTERQAETLVLKGLLITDFDGNYILTDAGLAKREETLRHTEAEAREAEIQMNMRKRAHSDSIIERLANADAFDEDTFMQLRGLARHVLGMTA